MCLILCCSAAGTAWRNGAGDTDCRCGCTKNPRSVLVFIRDNYLSHRVALDGWSCINVALFGYLLQ